MTISFNESFETRDVSATPTTKDQTAHYFVHGEPEELVDEDNVLNLVAIGVVIPRWLGGLPLHSADVERINDKVYKVSATFQFDDRQKPEGENNFPQKSYSVDTSGGTIHITNGLKVISKVGDVSEKIGTALNVDEEGKVQGIDITSPVFNFHVSLDLPDSQVTSGLLQAIYEGTGKVNNAPFTLFGIQYLTRDLYFLGAQINTTQVNNEEVENKWTLNYSFVANKSLINHVLNKDLVVPLKSGWDNLTVLYERFSDKIVKKRVPKAVGAYVTQVFEELDFSTLGAFDDEDEQA